MSDRIKHGGEPKPVRYEIDNVRARLFQLPALALLLALVVELFNRGLSPVRLGRFVFEHPGVFLYSALIILTTLLFSELFHRRRAVLACISILWVVLGVVQFMTVRDRTQPFCAADALMMKDAFSLITLYYTWPQIILIFSSAFAVIFLVIMLFARMKRRKHFNFPMSLATFVGFVLLTTMIAALGVHAGVLPQRFDNLVDTFNDYGFVTCFTFTFGRTGISKPDEYSPQSVADILTEIEQEPESDELVYPVFDENDNLAHPNILFLQLESFIDVGTIKGCELSVDPTSWFNRLCARFPTGLLYVPTIGGGTANTEFEIISGLSLDFFAAGEYPYNTILQSTACETMCYNLKDYGYVSTAMHNNSASFYSRNIVYPNMGFDRFVPLEYMENVKYTPLGWAKDKVLTDEILTALTTTEERDMIYCIGVETHGKYAETYEPQDGDIEVLSLPDEIPLAPFQNFVNALPGTDNFLHELTLALLRFDEPTIVIAYGDHLPALGLDLVDLTTGSIYASRYVIWNNFGGQFEAPDLEAYRLNANVLKQLGFSGGVVTKLHQSVEPDATDDEYLGKLELLEYDMLYGDQAAFGGDAPYVRTDMRMGSREIAITDAVREYHRLLISGENFTEFSVIIADGQQLETLYVDSGHIVARVADDADIGSLCVAQVGKDGVELGRTAEFTGVRNGTQ